MRNIVVHRQPESSSVITFLPSAANSFPMKALVYVSLKRSVLDPQGKTIQGALNKMGYKGLQDVRQGKYFEITLDGGLARNDAEAEIGKIAREVLTNPVIEEFRYSIED